MTTYNGKCHCGETEWTVKLDEPGHVLWFCLVLSDSPLPYFLIFYPRLDWPSLPLNSSLCSTYLADPSLSPCSHCDACKLIGGGCEYTMNAIATKSDVKVTKGSLKTYVYRGDSGMFHFSSLLSFIFSTIFFLFLVSPTLGKHAKRPAESSSSLFFLLYYHTPPGPAKKNLH